MRFIWQPQSQVVLSGSCSNSRRGRCAGSGARLGCSFLDPLAPLLASSSSAQAWAMSASSVSSSRLRCAALNCSLVAANFSRFRTASSWVSLSTWACLKATSRSRRWSCSPLAATWFISDSSASRICCGSRSSRDCEAITERDRAGLTGRFPSAHSRIALLQDPDDTGFADALPGQAQHKCVELGMAQCQRRRSVLGPDELAAVQSSRGQPDTDAVVHEHLHAIGTGIGEQVAMMRAGFAEDLHHASKGGLGPGSHVQRLDGQPQSVQTDHRSNSRIQAAHSAAALAGQVTTTVVVPRRSSKRISTGTAGGTGKATATKAEEVAEPSATFATGSLIRVGMTSASRTQRRSRLALIPTDIATAANDTPGCTADATALALNSSLCSLRRRPLGVPWEGIVSTCPPKS